MSTSLVDPRPDGTEDVEAVLDELREFKISMSEARRILRLSNSALHHWRNHPETPLECRRFGGRWYTSRGAIVAFIGSRSRPLTGPVLDPSAGAGGFHHRSPRQTAAAVRSAVDELARQGA